MSDQPRRPRRTVLGTLGALATGAIAAVTTAGASPGESPGRPAHAANPRKPRPPFCDSSAADVAVDDVLDGTDLYVGVVDRIVDGEHVVLLLEDGEAVVDQLVLSVDRFDEIAADDILLVASTEGELHASRRIPSKPNGCPDPDFDRLSSDA